MTPQQHETLFEIFQRKPGRCWCSPLLNRNYYTNETFDEFVKRAGPPLFGGDCIMIEWQGMWIGIEKNGHPHT